MSKWEIHEDIAAKAANALKHDPRGMRAITTPDTQIWHSNDGVWKSFHETLDNTGALYASLKAENRAPRFEFVGGQATTTGALVQAMVTGMGDVPIHIVVVLTVEDGVVTNLLEYSAPSALPIPDPRFVEITSSVNR